jgi:hypothetical protein
MLKTSTEAMEHASEEDRLNFGGMLPNFSLGD